MVARLTLRLAGIGLVLASLLLTAAFALRAQPPPELLLRLRIGLNLRALLYDPATEREFGLDSIPLGAPSLLWSPDSRWIVYRDRGSALAAYNLTTGHNHIIVGSQPDSINPMSWSPDSRWLLLRETNRSDLLYVPFEADGPQAPQKLDSGIYDTQWSPDGARLYVRDALKALSVIDAACLAQRAVCVRSLVPNSRPVEQFAGWMPDGHTLMIVSLSETTGRPQIFSLNPDDGTTRLIVAAPLPGAIPVWTPAGNQFAAPLLLPPSPDSEPPGDGIAGAYLIDPATDEQSLIWTGIVGDLSWTRDGSQLAFDLISRVDNRHSVWVYDRASGSVHTLTPPQSYESLPAWGSFSGRPLNALGLAALAGALLIVLWLTRRQPARAVPWRRAD